MIRNNQKTNVNKYFFFLILVICLIFTSTAYSTEHSYAVDVNLDNSSGENILITEDKLENSQSNDESLKLADGDSVSLNSSISDENVKLASSNDNELLGKTYSLKDGSFEDINDLIKKASAGDTIKLSGTFKASNADSKIKISKKITITSDSTATLNGRGIANIMRVYETATGTVIKNLKFINGWASRGGGLRISADNVHVENCYFENNHANNSGALSTEVNLSSAQNLVVKSCTFIKNNAYYANLNGGSAGAVGVFGYNTQVIDCYFESNYVKSNDGCVGGALQIGMDNVNSNSKVINCVFKNNAARSAIGKSHGGAGCVRDGVEYSECTFINNSADHGGALTMHSSGTISNCKFINNTAKTLYGGAISSGFLYDTMVLNIKNCHFEGNTAPEGGAIQAIGLNVIITNSNFIKNKVKGNGGAISIQAVDVKIDKSNFTNNLANVNGGAIYITGTGTVVSNSLFSSNKAVPDTNKLNDGLGGAIYVKSLKATINKNEFKYNTARNGSAIYYEKSGNNLNLVNNVLLENQAWVYQLPISTKDIYYQDKEDIKVVIYGGNNIANYEDLTVSNAIYNAGKYSAIMIDGENPIQGATASGEIYQDSREYNIEILLKVEHEDGEVIYENTLNSSYLGEINITLNDLRPGTYRVSAKHFEDTYYKEITNVTTFRVIPLVDNQITITTNSTTYNYEDVVVWTINITNNGPNNASEVYITVPIPDGLICMMDSSGGLYNSTTGILNVSTLNVGEKRSFNIITIVDKTGKITTNAQITALETDTDLSNNYDNQTININPATDIEVSKTVNNTNPNYMDIVTWNIVVKNKGPDAAHNITIRDVVPSTLTLINCSAGYDSKKGEWQFESLGVDEEIRVNLTTQVTSTGVIENEASSYADEYDYDLSNNRDNDRVLVDPAADLSIVKTVNTSNVNYLDTVKWTLTITNNGPDTATDVKIVDYLPEGFIYLNSSIEYNDDDEIYIGNLSVGETVIVDIICLVETTGNYTNYAEVFGNQYDHDLDNNHDNESITVNPAADLEIEKTVDVSEPEYGDRIYWTIVVKNNGPDTAHNVSVTELFSNDLIYVSDDSEGDYNPLIGIWDICTLDMDEEVALEICTIVNKTGIITNHANVTVLEYDYDLDNNEAEEIVEVEPSADLGVIKTVNNTSPNYYDFVKWTVTVFNNGPDNATNVEIIENIPDGLILINSTASKGTYIDGIWSIESMDKDESQTLELICKVNKTGNITNIVEVSAEEYDPNSTNNETNKTINVPPAVDISVIIDVNNSKPYFGEEIVWLVTIKNNGPDNASEVNLTDILPHSLIFADYNTTKGEYSDGVWYVGSLGVSEVEYLNITCIANETGVIINEAYAISNEYDWNMSNNYDNALIDVLPVTDLSIEKLVNNTNPNYLDIIKWTLKVYNNGPNYAKNVEVSDILPEGLEFIKSSDDKNYKNGIWYIGEMETGDIRQLDIICKVISTGIIKNTANVGGDNFDPDMDNNEAEEFISIRPASDLSVTKITSKKHYVAGDMVKYTITVVNNGPDTAHNVSVSEILDKSLVLKSFKASKGYFDKSTKTWKIDSLENGESAVLIIKVIATADGVIKNMVVVTSDSYDFNTDNNNDTCLIDVDKKPIVKNTTVPHKEIKAKKPVLHKTGNPIVILLISILGLSSIFYRKII